MSVRPGTRLDGRYRLGDQLGRGSLGQVWRATDELLDRSVAVRILRPERAADDGFVLRFRNMARTVSGLPHGGIAAVYDFGQAWVDVDGEPPGPGREREPEPVTYLVMELVSGEALSSALAREGPLGLDETLDLVAQAARALHAAHQRDVIHGRVSPSQLMVTPWGRVKVTDFGMARRVHDELLTVTGRPVTAAAHLAPELIKGADPSPLSDVYALGVVAYECLAGRRPFGGDHFEGDDQGAVAPAHLDEELPPLPDTISRRVRVLIGQAMDKDPSLRVASAGVFAASLESLR